MGDYRDLKVWQFSHSLTIDIYKLTKNLPEEEKFGLTSQLRRASSSIPTNIAEGYGQLSNGNFVRFLGMARGSSVELDYLLQLSYELGYLCIDDYNRLKNNNVTIKSMLNGLIKSLSNKKTYHTTI